MKTKDPAIVELLSQLDLASRGWVVVDHWEGDLSAVGIAHAAEPRRLVYISTFGKAEGRFDYECELPGGSKEDYEVAAMAEDSTFDELLEAIIRHLDPLSQSC